MRITYLNFTLIRNDTCSVPTPIDSSTPPSDDDAVREPTPARRTPRLPRQHSIPTTYEPSTTTPSCMIQLCDMFYFQAFIDLFLKSCACCYLLIDYCVFIGCDFNDWNMIFSYCFMRGGWSVEIAGRGSSPKKTKMLGCVSTIVFLRVILLWLIFYNCLRKIRKKLL